MKQTAATRPRSLGRSRCLRQTRHYNHQLRNLHKLYVFTLVFLPRPDESFSVYLQCSMRHIFSHSIRMQKRRSRSRCRGTQHCKRDVCVSSTNFESTGVKGFIEIQATNEMDRERSIYRAIRKWKVVDLFAVLVRDRGIEDIT